MILFCKSFFSNLFSLCHFASLICSHYKNVLYIALLIYLIPIERQCKNKIKETRLKSCSLTQVINVILVQSIKLTLSSMYKGRGWCNLIEKHSFFYQKSLLLTFDISCLLQNNFCEFTTQTLKFKGLFGIENSVLNAAFKDFRFTDINQTQMWYLWRIQ